MTKAQALGEAQRRWGLGAYVSSSPSRFFTKSPEPPRMTRFVYARYRGIIMGRGLTWEEAFADADRREKERSERCWA